MAMVSQILDTKNEHVSTKYGTLPETNSSNLEMDGWKTIRLHFRAKGLFSGAMLVLGRVFKDPNIIINTWNLHLSTLSHRIQVWYVYPFYAWIYPNFDPWPMAICHNICAMSLRLFGDLVYGCVCSWFMWGAYLTKRSNETGQVVPEKWKYKYVSYYGNVIQSIFPKMDITLNKFNKLFQNFSWKDGFLSNLI